MCSPSPWAEGEGRDGFAMDKAPLRGEVGEGTRELPAQMLCCINRLEMSRDSSARGDTEGHLLQLTS